MKYIALSEKTYGLGRTESQAIASLREYHGRDLTKYEVWCVGDSTYVHPSGRLAYRTDGPNPERVRAVGV